MEKKEKIGEVSASARAAYADLVFDQAEIVPIRGTRRSVKIRGVRPYTLECLTRLWLEREGEEPAEDGMGTLQQLCQDPYFSIKQASLFVLNGYWSIRLFHWLVWRWWAYVYQYSEEQMLPIISAGKKKLPLMAFWGNMAYTSDMRTDWVRMTAKEAEVFRQELRSGQNVPSSKTSPPMGK